MDGEACGTKETPKSGRRACVQPCMHVFHDYWLPKVESTPLIQPMEISGAQTPELSSESVIILGAGRPAKHTMLFG